MSYIQTLLASSASVPLTFANLNSLLRAVGLEYILDGGSEATLFAPIDYAFETLGQGKTYDLLKDVDRLTTLLRYLIVPMKLTTQDIVGFAEEQGQDPAKSADGSVTLQLPTAAGRSLIVKLTNDEFTVNGVRVIRSNMLADNGVIHAIESILWPAGITMEAFGTRSPHSSAPYDVKVPQRGEGDILA